MNEQEFQAWRLNCKKEIFAQLTLNYLKKNKRIKRKKEKEIQTKINLIGYKISLAPLILKEKKS